MFTHFSQIYCERLALKGQSQFLINKLFQRTCIAHGDVFGKFPPWIKSTTRDKEERLNEICGAFGSKHLFSPPNIIIPESILHMETLHLSEEDPSLDMLKTELNIKLPQTAEDITTHDILKRAEINFIAPGYYGLACKIDEVTQVKKDLFYASHINCVVATTQPEMTYQKLNAYYYLITLAPQDIQVSHSHPWETSQRHRKIGIGHPTLCVGVCLKSGLKLIPLTAILDASLTKYFPKQNMDDVLEQLIESSPTPEDYIVMGKYSGSRNSGRQSKIPRTRIFDTSNWMYDVAEAIPSSESFLQSFSYITDIHRSESMKKRIIAEQLDSLIKFYSPEILDALLRKLHNTSTDTSLLHYKEVYEAFIF